MTGASALKSPGQWWFLGIELRFWVAASVTALSAFASTALGLAVSKDALGIVFLATLSLYNLDGSLDAPARELSRRRRRLHLGLSVVAASCLAVLLLRVQGLLALVIVAGFLASSFYALPLKQRALPVSALKRNSLPPALSLKSLPGFKAPFVGFAVGSAAVLVPYLAASSSARGSAVSAAVLGLLFSLACTVNALLFDLPDLKEDAVQSVPTLPHLLGVQATKRVCLALIGVGIFGASAAGDLLPGGTVFPFIFLWLALVIATAFTTPETPKSTLALFVDGALILPWAVQSLDL